MLADTGAPRLDRRGGGVVDRKPDHIIKVALPLLGARKRSNAAPMSGIATELTLSMAPPAGGAIPSGRGNAFPKQKRRVFINYLNPRFCAPRPEVEHARAGIRRGLGGRARA